MEKFPGTFVPNFNDARNLPTDIQFLVFDNYSTKRHLNLSQLRGLADSNATGGYLNRRAHGPSYTPPEDVQVIVLSNQSPYEIYASWDYELRRKVMTPDVLSGIETRFNITRLDGYDVDEKIKWMSPGVIKETDMKACMKRLREEYIDDGEDGLTLTSRWIKECRTLYTSWKPLEATREDFINTFFTDQLEAELCRLLFYEDMRAKPEKTIDRLIDIPSIQHKFSMYRVMSKYKNLLKSYVDDTDLCKEVEEETYNLFDQVDVSNIVDPELRKIAKKINKLSGRKLVRKQAKEESRKRQLDDLDDVDDADVDEIIKNQKKRMKMD